jgi:calcineurin-like phosphoesterase family protein
MAGRTFAIGDPHFEHPTILQYRGFETVEEHDTFIVDMINATADKRDVILFLGDVCFGGASRLDSIMKRIICKSRKLALGNHDKLPMSEYIKHFSKIGGTLEKHKKYTDPIEVNGKKIDRFKKIKVVFSHVPVHPACMDRWTINIHAHLHLHTFIHNDDRYINSSLEATDYRLIDVNAEMDRAYARWLTTVDWS